MSPSDLGGAKALPGESADLTTDDAKRRGRQVHAMLDALAPIPAAGRRHALQFVLTDGEDAILDHERDALFDEVEHVLDAPYDWAVFGSNSLSEVPFTCRSEALAGRGVSGIVDRIIITDERIQIVDFKTNTVIPETVDTVPEGLLRQLGAYADAMAQIYPDRTIDVALLWTRSSQLMPIPLDIVREALHRTTTS